jgi:hypothetical protein
MIGAYVRRGVAAGLLAGVFAGFVGLVLGEPALDEAIAIEEGGAAAPAAAPAAHDEAAVTRPQQKAGLVAGYALVGAAAGAVFALASAWAVGRVRGDGWTRSLKLGAVATGALVLLPVLKYPPNPPGIGDPQTVGLRTLLYLTLSGIGLVLAAAVWAASRQFGTPVWRPLRQSLTAAGVVAAVVVILAVLPRTTSGDAGFPAELLWRFRLAAVATQGALWAAMAVFFGLLTARSERPARSRHAHP